MRYPASTSSDASSACSLLNDKELAKQASHQSDLNTDGDATSTSRGYSPTDGRSSTGASGLKRRRQQFNQTARSTASKISSASSAVNSWVRKKLEKPSSYEYQYNHPLCTFDTTKENWPAVPTGITYQNFIKNKANEQLKQHFRIVPSGKHKNAWVGSGTDESATSILAERLVADMPDDMRDLDMKDLWTRYTELTSKIYEDSVTLALYVHHPCRVATRWEVRVKKSELDGIRSSRTAEEKSVEAIA